MLKRLWNDECGAVLSAEIMLIATILVIGVITGLNAVRVAVVTELADTGAAIGAVDQSYSYDTVVGHHAFTTGSQYGDLLDTCDDGQVQAGVNSRCIQTCDVGNPGER